LFPASVLAGFLALTTILPKQPEPVRVARVIDGDTIKLTTGRVARLQCLDSAELSQRPAGPAARAALQQLLPVGSTVTLQAKTRDKYGRTVAEVFSGGRNINQALVASGAAFVYWQYIAGCDRNTYARLEQQAKAQRWGVWSDPALQLPWEYRRCRRSGGCR
jgi:endonuclease YncB( thermonuclease family)